MLFQNYYQHYRLFHYFIDCLIKVHEYLNLKNTGNIPRVIIINKTRSNFIHLLVLFDKDNFCYYLANCLYIIFLIEDGFY